MDARWPCRPPIVTIRYGLWHLETGQTLRTLEAQTSEIGRVTGLALTSDGRHAVSSSYDETVILWDLEAGKKIASFTGDRPKDDATK
jgi:WD40 repeat protein